MLRRPARHRRKITGRVAQRFCVALEGEQTKMFWRGKRQPGLQGNGVVVDQTEHQLRRFDKRVLHWPWTREGAATECAKALSPTASTICGVTYNNKKLLCIAFSCRHENKSSPSFPPKGRLAWSIMSSLLRVSFSSCREHSCPVRHNQRHTFACA